MTILDRVGVISRYWERSDEYRKQPVVGVLKKGVLSG